MSARQPKTDLISPSCRSLRLTGKLSISLSLALSISLSAVSQLPIAGLVLAAHLGQQLPMKIFSCEIWELFQLHGCPAKILDPPKLKPYMLNPRHA